MLYLSILASKELEMGKAPNQFKVQAMTCGEYGRGRTLGVLTCNKPIQVGNFVTVGETGTKKPKLLLATGATGQHQGYVVRANASGSYTRGTSGWLEILRGEPKLLAEGYCAWGDAGRIGGYTDNIYAMKIGDVIRVRRASPGKGCEPYFIIAAPERLVTLTEADFSFWIEQYEGETMAVKGRGEAEYIIPVY
jgi:hypothetical protein